MVDKQRISLDLGEDNIDLEELTGLSTHVYKPTVHQQKAMEEEGEKLGFVSRQSRKRPVRKRSPYTVQNNFKTRVGMKELLQEVSDRLETYDQETLELAMLALIEKEKLNDLLKKYNELVT